MGDLMTFDEIQTQYQDILNILAQASGKTIDEIDAEITETMKQCTTIDEFLQKISGGTD